MEWIYCHKEIIAVFTNIALVFGVAISALLIFLNVLSLRRMRKAYQAELFFKIAENIDSLVKEQAQREKEGPISVEYWYERLINVFEDFGFFANRKLLSNDMIDHYVPSLLKYCDSAADYSKNLRAKLADRTAGGYSEIKKIYEKRRGKSLPF